MATPEQILAEEKADWNAIDWTKPIDWTPHRRAQSIVFHSERFFKPVEALDMIHIIEQAIVEGVKAKNKEISDLRHELAQDHCAHCKCSCKDCT